MQFFVSKGVKRGTFSVRNLAQFLRVGHGGNSPIKACLLWNAPSEKLEHNIEDEAVFTHPTCHDLWCQGESLFSHPTSNKHLNYCWVIQYDGFLSLAIGRHFSPVPPASHKRSDFPSNSLAQYWLAFLSIISGGILDLSTWATLCALFPRLSWEQSKSN